MNLRAGRPAVMANDRGDLIRIAAPDIWSNAAKQEFVMFEGHVFGKRTAVRLDCVLASSNNHVETLSLRSTEAPDGLVEVVIHTQLLTARNPEGLRVKSRTFIERQKLADLQRRIADYLAVTADGHTANRLDAVSYGGASCNQ